MAFAFEDRTEILRNDEMRYGSRVVSVNYEREKRDGGQQVKAQQGPRRGQEWRSR